MNAYVARVYADLEKRNAHEKEFLQAAKEVLEALSPVFDKHPEYEDKGLLERLQSVINTDFVRLDYTEGIRILQEAIKGGRKFEFPCNWGDDLASEHERYLVEEHFKKPVIMTHYPKKIKAFYMKIDEELPELNGQKQEQTVQGTDVLFRNQGTQHSDEGYVVVSRHPPLRYMPPRRIRPGL